MYNMVICRYHEIAIKGNNRDRFERCLIDNIQYKLRAVGGDCRVRRVRGRVWIEKPHYAPFTEAELAGIRELLPKVFGIENFSFVIRSAADIGELKEKLRAIAAELFAPHASGSGRRVPFRIRARRSDKNFPLCSNEVEIALATVLAEELGEENLKVDLEHAELSVYCEIRDEFAFLYFDTIPGPGGLPVGSNGPVLALLSGGIDSPVACYVTMKRGCPVDYVAFHSPPYTPPETRDKICRVARHMNEFQRFGRLFFCNLAPFQKAVRDCCNERYRTVLYRRAMLRIAELLARKNHRLALLTGDSVGQVASQTIENMTVIDNASDMLVLRPLLGYDKAESIAVAQKIGSYELSIVSVPDSCTVFSPGSPTTAAKLDRVEAEEARIADYAELIAAAAEGAQLEEFQRAPEVADGAIEAE